MMKSFMERGLRIVMDETNTNELYLKKLLDIADKYGYKKYAIVFSPNVPLCIERSKNTTDVPDDVIINMAIK